MSQHTAVAAYRPRGPLVVRHGGRVAGCCGVARALGVAPGWTVDRALRVVPTAVVVPHKPRIIRTFRESVRAQAHALTPFLEESGLGLLYLGVDHAAKLAELAEVVGARMGAVASRRLARMVAAAAPPSTLRVADGAAADVLAQVPTPVLGRLGTTDETVERLQLFGLDRALYVELTHHLRPGDNARLRRLQRLAAVEELPTVATGDVRYADRAGHARYDVLICVAEGCTVFVRHSARPLNAKACLKTEAELRKLIADDGAFERAAALAAACHVDLMPGAITPPHSRLVPEGEAPEATLRRLC